MNYKLAWYLRFEIYNYFYHSNYEMKIPFHLIFIFTIPCIFVSCETGFNAIADYKEIAIVYGVLNQEDTIHYLRINKAFSV